MKNLHFISVLLFSIALHAQHPIAPVPVADTTFVNLKEYNGDFHYDLKYASSDNFLKEQVYDCGECYLRYKTVKALIAANEVFKKLGYKISIFDCYRPVDIQKRMWRIIPNPTYVADPAKGSIHNRGGAVDITLLDKHGNQVDMGTPFDHFGPESAHAYNKLSEQQKNNRRLLREVMVANGFAVFESEWWHYNLQGAASDDLSNFSWPCH